MFLFDNIYPYLWYVGGRDINPVDDLMTREHSHDQKTGDGSCHWFQLV